MRRAVGGILLVAVSFAGAACGDDRDAVRHGDVAAPERDDPSSPSVTSRTVPPPAPGDTAPCTTEAYREAAALGIDGGHYPIANERCDGQWAAFDLDFGAEACPPEDDSCRGVRVHRTFWRAVDGRWSLIAYQGTGDCAEVHDSSLEFPEEICAP